MWQNGWSPTTQGLSTTDDITINRNNNGELQVKDSGITFIKLNPNTVSTQNENSNNKVVRSDAMYNTAITKNVSQIKTKTGGGKEIEIDLQNEANVSKTKVNIDLDETATQNSNNPITSNGVWKEELNNTTSTLEYDDTNTNKDVINLELKNNNGDTRADKTIDFNDKIAFKNKTQELFNKTLDFDATSATKNIAENIPLSSLAKQTASDDKKILQVVGNDHHIDLSFLDVIKEVNSIPQTKYDEDVLLHLANDDRLYYWNEDEGAYVAVGSGSDAIIDVASLPTTDIKDNVFYRVPAEEIFIHNGDRYSSVVCFQCEAGYVSIDATGITDTYSGTDPIFYSWENLTDTIINSLMQPVSTSTGNKYPISITNFSKDVNHFCKYGDNLYDSANNFIHTYNYQLFIYKDGAWEKFYTKTEADKKFLDKQNFLNNLYPKDSIYPTWSYKNPSTFLGGTWVLIGGQDANLNYYPAFAIETDTAGTTISESLPNITGSIGPKGMMPMMFGGNYNNSGALFTTDKVNEYQVDFENYRETTVEKISFDANKSSPIYQDNTHVNVNAIKIFFWRRTDDAPVVFNTGNITMDTKLDKNATDDHIPTSKAVVDYTNDNFASINTLFAKNIGGYHGDIDGAVFDFGNEAISWGRAKDTRTYTQMALIDPIDNSNLYGYVETTQTVVFTYQTMIEQTFTTFFRQNGEGMANGILKRFKRTGYYNSNNDSVLANPKTNYQLINWLPWYPVEYPAFQIARNTTNTTSGVICAIITGGVLKIELEAIKLASAPGGNSVIIATLPTGLNTALKSWPGGATYYRGFAFNVNGTTSHSGLIQAYKNDGKIYIFGNFVANENIWGSITATLGY